MLLAGSSSCWPSWPAPTAFVGCRQDRARSRSTASQRRSRTFAAHRRRRARQRGHPVGPTHDLVSPTPGSVAVATARPIVVRYGRPVAAHRRRPDPHGLDHRRARRRGAAAARRPRRRRLRLRVALAAASRAAASRSTCGLPHHVTFLADGERHEVDHDGHHGARARSPRPASTLRTQDRVVRRPAATPPADEQVVVRHPGRRQAGRARSRRSGSRRSAARATTLFKGDDARSLEPGKVGIRVAHLPRDLPRRQARTRRTLDRARRSRKAR